MPARLWTRASALAVAGPLALGVGVGLDRANGTFALATALVCAVALTLPRAGPNELVAATGFALWSAAYACWLYAAVHSQGPWPPFFGAYWLAFELVVALTDWLDDGDDGRTLRRGLKSRLGFAAFAVLDASVIAAQIWYGTASEWDELGIFPVRTLEERLATFGMWFSLHVGVFCAVGQSFRSVGRRVKYLGYALHFLAHAAVVASPSLAPGAVDLGLRLSTLGNAAWTSRYGNPDLPEPRRAFEFLMLALPVWCVAAVHWAPQIKALTPFEFRLASAEWGVFWTAVALLAPQARRRVAL